MAIVVVGGHSRNIGKTSVVAALIAALPEMQWTAFKVTQFGHGLCSANGEPCECETDRHTVAITEERSTTSGTDTARFLAAGAVRCFWVRTRMGQLAEAMPRVRKELAASTHAIVESNSIVRLLRPDLYLAVLDPAVRDFKPSAQYVLDRADAVLWSDSRPAGHMAGDTLWPSALLRMVRNKPQFTLDRNTYSNQALTQFVAQRLVSTKASSNQ
jgi:molybdopterin-guanine dinucleotide biosynthesis protein